MPNTAQGETQQIRLTQVPVETVRRIKAEAALAGVTLDDYLTDWIVDKFKTPAIVEDERESA